VIFPTYYLFHINYVPSSFPRFVPIFFLQFFYITHSFVAWFLFPYFILILPQFDECSSSFSLIHLFHFLINSFISFPSFLYVDLSYSFIKSILLYFPNFQRKSRFMRSHPVCVCVCVCVCMVRLYVLSFQFL